MFFSIANIRRVLSNSKTESSTVEYRPRLATVGNICLDIILNS